MEFSYNESRFDTIEYVIPNIEDIRVVVGVGERTNSKRLFNKY